MRTAKEGNDLERKGIRKIESDHHLTICLNLIPVEGSIPAKKNRVNAIKREPSHLASDLLVLWFSCWTK